MPTSQPGWRGGGTLRDLVRGGRLANDAVLTGGPTWVSGRYGAALLTGSTSYAVTPAMPVRGRFTLAALVEPTSSQTGYSRIAETSYSTNYYLGVDSAGSSYFWIVNNNSVLGVTGGAVTVGEPAHLVGTFDGSTSAFYSNGILAGTRSESAPSGSPMALYIGQYFLGGFGWTGLIYSLRLYDRALGAGEATALYHEARRGFSETVLWLPPRWFPEAPAGADTYTGDGAVTSAPATAAGTGTHTAPTYTGTAAVSSAAATASASGTHTAPTYTATAAVSSAPATASASGTHTAPTYTGTAAVSSAAATAAATGIHTEAGVYTGVGAVTTAPATAAGLGTYTGLSYGPALGYSPVAARFGLTGLRAERFGLWGLRASDFRLDYVAPPITSGIGAAIGPVAIASGVGTHTAPTYTGTGEAIAAAAVAAASGTHTSSLNTDLIAYWKLNEASGTRSDAVGSNHLTDNNGVESADGQIGNAALFVGAMGEWLNRADNADLSMGDIDFTLAFWTALEGKPGPMGFLGKWGPGATAEYLCYYSSAADRIAFIVSPDGTAATQVEANTLGSPALTTWYLVIAWHDAAANTINIQVNNGSVDSAAHTTGVFNGAADFEMGRYAAGQYLSARVDAAGVWKRVLTAGERTALYNGGAGLELP